MHTYTFMHTYTHTHRCSHTHAHIQACLHTHTQTHVHTGVHTHAHLYAHTDTKVWVTPDQLFHLQRLLFVCKKLVYIVSDDLFQCCMQLKCFYFYFYGPRNNNPVVRACVWIDWRRNGVLRPRETTFHSSLKHSCIPSDFFASV